MSRTFLPPLRPDGVFAPPQVYNNSFVGGTDSLIADLHASIAAAEANSEGRVPSPFARVWQFRRNLAGDCGEQEKVRAVAAWRGLLAMFALRDYYHLKLEVDVTPCLAADPISGDTPISRLFEVHTGYLPQPRPPATGQFLFGRRLVFFRLMEPAGTPDTTVAGYSPLTLFYPAARSLEHSRALVAIFWYDRETGRWHDPANPPASTQRRLSQEARAHLAAWLDEVLAVRAPGGQRLAIVADEGLAPEDERFLVELLTAWRKELVPRAAAAPAPDTRTKNAPLPKSAELCEVELAEGITFQPPRLLEKVYRGAVPPTDLPVLSGGVLLLTLEKAAQASQRLYGNVFGSPEAAACLAASPAEGADLGAALGRPGEAPVAYVTVDLLFTPWFGRIQNGKNTVSLEWTALPLLDKTGAGGVSSLEGVYLLPFDPAILRYFSAQEIRDGAEARFNVAAAEVIFRHEASGLRVSRLYDVQREIYPLDPSLDLRFFPKFRLDNLAKVEQQLPFPEDRRYYARMRLSPTLDPLTMKWLDAGGAPLAEVTSYPIGDYDQPVNPELVALGRQMFWRLPSSTPPGAFQVEGIGLALLTLGGSDHRDQTPRSWTVALDFGTTNSCVAVDVGAGNVDAAYRLPVLTTPLFSFGKYSDLRGKSSEGASALADFMFWQKTDASVLNENDFFPTQVLTRHGLRREKLPFTGSGFDERNGLAFFPNVSLMAVEQEGFTDLIESFGAMRTTSIKSRFNLKRNLKWKDENEPHGNALVWRTAFHQHLRLHLILAAAAENAFVEQLVASYPKAFTPTQKENYEKELKKVWGEPEPDSLAHEGMRKSATSVELRSESAAAALALGITRGQEFFLLDMGGGTTDVAVFKDNVLEEECSLTLAGQVLERYVCESDRLRAAIARDLEDSLRLGKKAFAAPGQDAQVYQTLFQGLLVKLKGAKALLPLRERESRDPATQGFFLSAVLLYTGLAYFCGLWLAKRRRNGEGITAEERLQWLGNGSSFIHMLGVADKSFEDVLVRMFNAACEGTARVSKLRADAKTVVAKGLLRPPAVRAATGAGQQVFSHLLSNSVTFAGRKWSEDDALSDFYRQLSPQAMRWDGLAEGQVFRRYLEALQTELPKAQLNKSSLINLGALGIKDAQNWAIDYVTAHRAGVEKELFERLKDNKDHWGEVLQTGSADSLYVEPLFVSELTAVLEQTREAHA